MNDILLPLTTRPATTLRGSTAVPGDKSISHRALILSSQAIGKTEISGLLEGEDVLRTATALRQCGVPITRDPSGIWHVNGVGIGGLQAPDDVLDMGNAGTAARLLMGLLSPYPYTSLFTGDASLRKRPMQRVIAPLSQTGAAFWTREGGRLPLAMKGTGEPLPIHYTLPVASAQVKSAILLAGLNTPGITTVIEHEATRDHTERMLRYFGIDVTVTPDPEGGVRIALQGQPPQTLTNRTFTVPGDPSSAAFPMVAAVITPNSEVTLTNICLNPLRTGLFNVLKRMGADLTIHNQRDIGGEPVGDITVRSTRLNGIDIEAQIAPSMIDEYPILAIAAACATGETRMRGLAELRVKESDRLNAILNGLTACGVAARAEGDDLIVTGTGNAPQGGGAVTTHFDHRIAMSFYVLGLVAQSPITIDDQRAISTSFPGFLELMAGLHG